MIKIAILGAGNIAGFQIKAFECAGFQVIAAASKKCSITINEFCNKHKIINVISDPRDLIYNEEWGAIYLSVPTSCAIYYLKLLEHSKRPILVEKPITLKSSLFSNILNNNNIRVAYNRRFYDGVRYIKDFLIDKNNVLVKVCIPESTLKIDNISLIKGLPVLTFENSVHIFDLLNYLCGKIRWEFKKYNHDSICDTIKYVVANGISDKGYRIILDIYYEASANFTLEFICGIDRIVLQPIEIMNHYRGIEVVQPTKEVPLRIYQPKIHKTIYENNDKGIKPGLQKQAEAFFNFCNDKNSDELATLQDAESAIKLIEKLV